MRNYMVMLILSLLTNVLTTKAQDWEQTPKNFPAVFAGIEWNTLSGLKGIEYERLVFGQNNLAAGIKASHMFRYKEGNLNIFGENSGVISNITTVMATGHLFTSGIKSYSGFFLQAGLGAGVKNYKGPSFNVARVSPAAEVGLGWQFDLGRGAAIKWTNTITFPSRNAGITCTRIAFGF